MSKEVTREEQVESWMRWKQHINRLEQRGVVSRDELYSLRMHVSKPDDIGYDQGQIRPGELGKWDVFFSLEGFDIPYEKRLLLADLPDSMVQQEMEKIEIRSFGYDPDNPQEVAEFHRIQRMAPEELDTEIKMLEALLAKA